METADIRSSIQILKTHLTEPEKSNEEQFTHLERSMKKLNLNKDNINDNFTGTIEEVKVYVSHRPNHDALSEHIRLNSENIKRWIEELQLLHDGGGAVTIDYEQRKGREI